MARLAWLVLVVPSLARADVTLGSDWYKVFSGAPPNKPAITRKGTVTAVTKTGATIKLDGTAYSLTGIALPLATGDAVEQTLQCFSAGPNQFCDGTLASGGSVFAISSGSGAVAIAKDWTITAEPAPHTCKSPASCSERHEMPLVMKHGKQQGKTKPEGWVMIDGWYATGSSISWEGMRPPEGTDYQSFMLIRKELKK